MTVSNVFFGNGFQYDGNRLTLRTDFNLPNSVVTGNILDANSRFIQKTWLQTETSFPAVIHQRSEGNIENPGDLEFNSAVGTTRYFGYANGQYRFMASHGVTFRGNIEQVNANTYVLPSGYVNSINSSANSANGEIVQNRVEFLWMRPVSGVSGLTQLVTPGTHSIINHGKSPNSGIALAIGDLQIYKTRGYSWNEVKANGATEINVANTYPMLIGDKVGVTYAYGYSGNGTIFDPAGVTNGFNYVGTSEWELTGYPLTNNNTYSSTYRIIVANNLAAPNANPVFQFDSGGNFIIPNTGSLVGNVLANSAVLGNVANVTMLGGSANQFLQTNGSGTLTWATPQAVASNSVPATATSNGTAGTVAYDGDYVYICVATDTWKRASLSTW